MLTTNFGFVLIVCLICNINLGLTRGGDTDIFKCNKPEPLPEEPYPHQPIYDYVLNDFTLIFFRPGCVNPQIAKSARFYINESKIINGKSVEKPTCNNDYEAFCYNNI
ncbi:hypothetical protein GJ496_002140 [Pomphorhynchus laevis]|nr:hypothetical protein GJ496_002140 [Pomphorhynchus laevis]